jgi:hypothetical protein
MTETEKAIITTLADVGLLVTEIGKTQALMAGFLAKHLPNLDAGERQVLSDAQKLAGNELQSLQQKITTLKGLL